MKLWVSPRSTVAAVATVVAIHVVTSARPAASDLPAVVEPPGFQDLTPSVKAQFVRLRDGIATRQARPGIGQHIVGRAYGLLGTWHHAYKYLDQAVVCYETATRLDANVANWPYLLGLIRKDRGETLAALRAFEQARALIPEYIPLLVAMAESAADAGNTSEAVELLDEALRYQPGQPRATLRLAQLANSAGDHARAVELLEPFVTSPPGPADLHYTIAQAYRGIGKRELASAHFELAGLSRGGQVPLVDPLLDAVTGMRRDGNAFNDRGQGAFARGALNDAIEQFRGAVEAVPDQQVYRINLAMTLLRAGRAEKGEAELRRVLEIEPTSPDAHYYLGVLAEGLQESEAAEQHFAEALRWDPRHTRSLTRLAALLTESGHGAEAVEYLERAISYDPGNSALRVKLGMLLTSLGRDRRAVEVLRLAVSAAPSSQESRFLLARILAASTDPAARDGRGALEIAQELFRSQPTLAVAETITAAFAELRELNRAVAWQQVAFDGAREAERLDELPWVEQRLRLYRSEQPLRRPWAEGEAEAVTFKIEIQPPDV